MNVTIREFSQEDLKQSDANRHGHSPELDSMAPNLAKTPTSSESQHSLKAEAHV
jgi:hypothetical protein